MMRPILSRRQIREFEQAAIAKGLPSVLLMENAGRGAAHLIGLWGKNKGGDRAETRDGRSRPASVGGSCVRCADEAPLRQLRVLVLAGSGNNGGDGFVVARHLHGRGAHVVTLAGSVRGELAGDAELARRAWVAVGGDVGELSTSRLRQELQTADIVVDALLGTGADREITGELAEWIDLINSSQNYVVALDVPSGLDADLGRVLGRAVVADHTVTFGHLKSGLMTTIGQRHAGRITISQIGIPSALPVGMVPRAWFLEASDLKRRVRERDPTAHKGTAGHVAVVAGGPGTPGAARLVGLAALRSGAGSCTLVSSAETSRILETDAVELMTHAFDANSPQATLQQFERADSLVVGPGLGSGDDARALVQLAFSARRPTVLDAAALRNLPGGLESLRAHAQLVLTPHPGEAGELLGTSSAAVEEDRFGAVEELARRSGAVVVLKGSRTLVAAADSPPFVSAWGSAALATAGSGDVLAGLLGALLAAQAHAALGSVVSTTFDAAILGVGIHGLCGEVWAEKHGALGLLASEITSLFSEARARLVGA